MSKDSKEKEADQLERKAKEELSKRDYHSAIEILEKAKVINQELGFQGKVNMIDKRIQRTRRLIAYETPLDSGYTPTFEKIEKNEISIDSPQSTKNQRVSKKNIETPSDNEKRKQRERIKKAEAVLDKGNKYINEHDYQNAKKCYDKSIQIFKDLGWKRQVQILEKERENIDLYENKFNKKSQKKKLDNKIFSPLEKEPSKLQKKSTNHIIKNQSADLTWAEKRRLEIRERVEHKMSEAENVKKNGKQILERENKIKTKKHKRLELKKKIQEKKQKEEKLLKDAEFLLDQAKGKIKSHQYDQAKEFYRQAIKVFKDLGWFSQVNNLYNEIENIEQYKQEYIRKQKEEKERSKKQKDAFQKRLERAKSEKEESEKRRLERIKSLSPENKRKLEKVNLLISKAEKEESRGKLKRAVGRYEIIIDLYNSLPQDKIDLSKDISEIKTKLSELRSKI